MHYSRFGIIFRLLKEEDIEMVRQWRNDPVVAANHEFREYITPEMQKEWFKSVNNICNLYMVVEYKGDRIGVINVKNIDWPSRTCEGGIFLPDPRYHRSSVPAIISFVATDFFFSQLGWYMTYAHVLRNNESVKSFMKMLGYGLMPGQDEETNQLYCLTRESFEKHAPRILKAIAAVAGDDDHGVLRIMPEERDNPLILQWEEIVRASSMTPEVIESVGGRTYYFL